MFFDINHPLYLLLLHFFKKVPLVWDYSPYPPNLTFCAWFSIKLCGYIQTHETNVFIHFVDKKIDIPGNMFFVLAKKIKNSKGHVTQFYDT